jgi:hypothetical protein
MRILMPTTCRHSHILTVGCFTAGNTTYGRNFRLKLPPLKKPPPNKYTSVSMKKIGIVFVFFFSHQLFSQNFTTENVKSYMGLSYHYYMLLGVVELKLETDYTYTARYESEGLYWYNTGKYKMEKGLIKLSPEVCKQFADTDENIDCSSTLGEAKIDLIKDDYSLYYTEYLFVQSRYNKQLLIEGKQNDNFRLAVPGKEVPEGLTRMVEQTQVTTMGMKKAVTNTSVKIRKTPDVHGEEIPYYAEIFADEKKSVPTSSPVTVIARTMEKTLLGKHENYWYYVQVGAHDGVWMFGEYLKFI